MKKLTFKEAAYKILKDSGRPMSSAEITTKAIESGLIETDGETPDASLGAQIYLDIKKNEKSLFVKPEKGKFYIKEKVDQTPSADILVQKQNHLVQQELSKKLEEIDPYLFEYLIADLIKKIGYENVEVTKRSGDGGIDVVANLKIGGLTDVKTIIQAKKYKVGNNVSGKTVRELRGSAEVDQRGLIITTSNFTKDAVEEAAAQNKMPVSLIDGEKLMALMFKYQVGLKSETISIYSIDSDYFESELDDEAKEAITSKTLSVWPLPGGISNYIQSLEAVLIKIGEKGIDKKDLVSWFKKYFENVKSDKTINGYINVPKSFGLISIKNAKVALTEDGVRYLKSKDTGYLFQLIKQRIFGIEEIVELLENDEKAKKDSEILEYLVENFKVNWETLAQVSFRLLWLQNLGVIEKTNDGYSIMNGKTSRTSK